MIIILPNAILELGVSRLGVQAANKVARQCTYEYNRTQAYKTCTHTHDHRPPVYLIVHVGDSYYNSDDSCSVPQHECARQADA